MRKEEERQVGKTLTHTEPNAKRLDPVFQGIFDDFLREIAEDTVNNGSGAWSESNDCLRCGRTCGSRSFCRQCELDYRELDYLEGE